MRITYQLTTVLYAVSRGCTYGYSISQATGIGSGTLYPLLQRLTDSGHLASRHESAQAAAREGRPPRCYNSLTPSGRRLLHDALQKHPVVRLSFDL